MEREVRDGGRDRIMHCLAGCGKEFDLFSRCTKKLSNAFETEVTQFKLHSLRITPAAA